jgi:hypothetical protein
MILLDTLEVFCGSEKKRIELYQGDLTNLKQDEAVDVLIVSAFPNDYTPTPSSLIGALQKKGVSVAQLATKKEIDLREVFSCWLSQEIVSPDPGIQFKHILCFEPLYRGSPPEVVGDIFRSLAPFLGGDPPIASVAMPLIATGDQEVPISEMLPPLLDAAVHWMALGFPLKCMKIVAHSNVKVENAKRLFSQLKRKCSSTHLKKINTFKHDIFISYARENVDAAALINKELKSLRHTMQIFIDRKSLKVGAAWQHEIFEALDSCRKVIALLSPEYLNSKVCKEEFNIAWARSRETDENILFPIYWYSAQLPTYMKVLQYVDCREGCKDKLTSACKSLLSDFYGQTLNIKTFH